MSICLSWFLTALFIVFPVTYYLTTNYHTIFIEGVLELTDGECFVVSFYISIIWPILFAMLLVILPFLLMRYLILKLTKEN